MIDPFLLTWMVLSLATLVSWWLDVTINGTWVGVTVLLVAFFKARLVLMVFMEVRDAAPLVRWCCEVWVMVACASLITIYWLTPHV